jgi:hypothetical protein
MKIKTFVILGSLFASLGIFSATTVLAQGQVVNYQGETYLFLPKGEELGPNFRCSRDGKNCYSLRLVDCDGTGCLYGFSLITTRTIFHNSGYADACWGSGDIYDLIIANNGIDCRIYGMSNRMFQERNRQAGYTDREFDDLKRKFDELRN